MSENNNESLDKDNSIDNQKEILVTKKITSNRNKKKSELLAVDIASIKEKIIPVPVHQLIKNNYYNYMLETNYNRSIPDIRDGLKPVQRRMLYVLHKIGATYNSSFIKSARVVGEIMGKYHPHGDASIYEAMVNKAQYWKDIVLLLKGQGNFGNMDGDGAAAMRYTEIKLSEISSNGGVFKDINKDIVDFIPNYDGTEQEPTVLPFMFPNLWVNGTSGIGVGYASDVPTHNLKETMDALLAYYKNPDITISEIMQLMPAPDFATGGIVHKLSGYRTALEKGKGSVRLMCKHHIKDNPEKSRKYKKILCLTELAGTCNKVNLVESLNELIKEDEQLGKWIYKINDESSGEESEVAIYLMDEGNDLGELIFNKLLNAKDIKQMLMPSINYNVNVVMPNGSSLGVAVGIKTIFHEFLKFRSEILIRKTTYELNEAKQKLHLLVGLTKVLSQESGLDTVIKIIKSHKTAADANVELQAVFDIDEIQAQEILRMQLQKLTATELENLKTEHTQLTLFIEDKTDLLAKDERIHETVYQELAEFRDKFGTMEKYKRKTEIAQQDININYEDSIKNESCLIILTENGYIKRIPNNVVTKQNRNGKGKPAIDIGDDDKIKSMINADTLDNLLFFTTNGNVYGTKVWKLPDNNAGRHLKNVFAGLDDPIVSMIAVTDEVIQKQNLIFDNENNEEETEDLFSTTNEDIEDNEINNEENIDITTLLIITKFGKIKRTDLSTYQSALGNRKNGIIGCKLEPNDEIIAVLSCKNNDHLMIVTSNNTINRFVVDNKLRIMRSKTAKGIMGVKLTKDETVLDALIVPVEPEQIKYNVEMVDNLVPDENGDVVYIGKKYRVEGQKEKYILNTELIDSGRYLLTMSELGVGKKISLSEFKVQKIRSKGVLIAKNNEKSGKLIKTLIVDTNNNPNVGLVVTTEQKTIKISVNDINEYNSRLATGVYLMNVDNNDKVVDIALSYDNAETTNED